MFRCGRGRNLLHRSGLFYRNFLNSLWLSECHLLARRFDFLAQRRYRSCTRLELEQLGENCARLFDHGLRQVEANLFDGFLGGFGLNCQRLLCRGNHLRGRSRFRLFRKFAFPLVGDINFIFNRDGRCLNLEFSRLLRFIRCWSVPKES